MQKQKLSGQKKRTILAKRFYKMTKFYQNLHTKIYGK